MARPKKDDNVVTKTVNTRWIKNNLNRILNAEISDGDYQSFKEFVNIADELKSHFENLCNKTRQERIAALQAEIDALNAEKQFKNKF